MSDQTLPFAAIHELAAGYFVVALLDQDVVHFSNTALPFATLCGLTDDLYSRYLSPDLSYDVCNDCLSIAGGP